MYKVLLEEVYKKFLSLMILFVWPPDDYAGYGVINRNWDNFETRTIVRRRSVIPVGIRSEDPKHASVVTGLNKGSGS